MRLVGHCVDNPDERTVGVCERRCWVDRCARTGVCRGLVEDQEGHSEADSEGRSSETLPHLSTTWVRIALRLHATAGCSHNQ